MNLLRWSIRARITVGATLIAALLLLVAGLIVYHQVERIMQTAEGELLAGIEAPYRTAITTEGDEELDPPGEGRLVLITDPSGAVRLDTMPSGLSEAIAEAGPPAGSVTQVAYAGDAYLVRTTVIGTAEGVWQVVTARDFGTSQQILDGVALLLIVSFAVIAAGFAASAWFISTASLRPVTRLQRSAERLAADERSGLLPTGPADDEIDALARTLNDLILRVRASADRERQVVSDASHELRTPLAILNARLEVALDPGAPPERVRADVAEAQRTLRRLIRIAQALLDLSRAEAPGNGSASTLERLAAETADAIDRCRTTVAAPGSDIDFAIDVAEPSAVAAVDAQDFGRVLDNLLSNAVLAAPDGSSAVVHVTLRQGAEAVDLLVADHSGGMPPDFVDRALDRFARADGTHYDGGGLGLSIVAAIVERTGGGISLANDPGAGLEVRVAFPLAPAG
ncbi:sensor histidine kinase [Agromyces sp. MMS24-K17]|uniref:sensor histidine kinase n=1 Tax=Agromyces sp. MMS24-K17 TaxID=3372850 RepID=UPI00375529E5